MVSISANIRMVEKTHIEKNMAAPHGVVVLRMTITKPLEALHGVLRFADGRCVLCACGEQDETGGSIGYYKADEPMSWVEDIFHLHLLHEPYDLHPRFDARTAAGVSFETDMIPVFGVFKGMVKERSVEDDLHVSIV